MKKSPAISTLISFISSLFIQGQALSSTDISLPTAILDNGLAYTEITQENADTQIIFIHGSPGSKEGYSQYLNSSKLEFSNRISVDRIGYGESLRPVELSLKKQALAIAPLLHSNKKNIIVGHSLGGPIALYLGLLFPNKVDGLVIIAPAMNPELEKPKWYNQIADVSFINWALTEKWSTSNQEMMVLEKELNLLVSGSWGALDIMEIVFIHGEKDSIADPRNTHFVIQKLKTDLPNQKNYRAMYPDEEHFILWDNPNIIIDQIIKLAK
ncbi:alpha/beta hydrolase [Vibrio sp.]|nr:alpha/beta hydrolase [Vibrio sp.]